MESSTSGARDGAEKILVIMTDGTPTKEGDAVREANTAKMQVL